MTPAVVVLTGPVGSGKTTVVECLRWALVDLGVTCAAVSQDALRMVSPEPVGDPFGEELGYRNLASVWPNLVRAGATVVLIATVVEDRAHSLARLGAALPGSKITIVRLAVPLDLVHARLRHRERTPSDLAWHLARSVELQQIMEARAVEDLLIEVGTRTPEDVAIEIIRRLDLGSPVGSA